MQVDFDGKVQVGELVADRKLFSPTAPGVPNSVTVTLLADEQVTMDVGVYAYGDSDEPVTHAGFGPVGLRTDDVRMERPGRWRRACCRWRLSDPGHGD
ncbi:hypothetical protein LP420_39805 [Massilia sp. B-10]|nr:hypothetical protein LP420_39805 [Massilia sp. B-10]